MRTQQRNLTNHSRSHPTRSTASQGLTHRSSLSVQVSLGGFELGPAFVSQLTEKSQVSLTGIKLPAEFRNSAHVSGRYVRISGQFNEDGGGDGGISRHIETIDGEDKVVYEVHATGERFTTKSKAEAALKKAGSHSSSGPTRIGDVRVSFEEVACHTVSVLGRQQHSSITEWDSSLPGYKYAVLHSGVQ